MKDVNRSFSMELVSRSDGLRRLAATPEDWAEVQRLEDMAVKAYALESLGERILASVMRAPTGAAGEALSARLSAIHHAAQRRQTRA
jgi:hypothetical protein